VQNSFESFASLFICCTSKKVLFGRANTQVRSLVRRARFFSATGRGQCQAPASLHARPAGPPLAKRALFRHFSGWG